MKKEQFFRLLGDLDDGILEQYRQMDAQLSQKMLRKKRVMRAIIIAACLALLIGACVPVGMMIAQLGNGPSDPLPTIHVQSLAELETMREMVECEDEQILNAYLHSITGGGARSRQDLIDFLKLVDSMPYARFIDGEITSLTYNETDEWLSVSVEANNGKSLYCNYQLGVSDVEKQMAKATRKLGRQNLLSAPLSTGDGRLTLYTETREPSANGDVIRWQGVLDGIAVLIVYRVDDADAIDTATLLESVEIAASVVPVFPMFSWANTEFGAFVENPEYERYRVVYESYSAPDVWVWVNQEGYIDPEAPLSYFANDLFSAEIGSLDYECTWPQTLSMQAGHIYQIFENGARYTVYLDAATGVPIGWEIGGKAQISIAASEQEMMDLAYAYLASCVSDPRAYTAQVTKEEGYTICSYVRYVGDLQTCDALTAYFDSEGVLVSIIWGYLGAFRHLEEIPNELIDTARADLTEMGQQHADTTEIKIKGLHIAPDGRVVLDCSISYFKTEPEEKVEYRYLAYLTEVKDAQETEPVVTEPVTTEPVTTEPVTTEPVTTQTPRETESNWDINDVPKLVKMGYLQISVRDEDGTVTSLLSPEELKNFSGEVDVEYKPGRMLVIEGYAGYNRNGQVRYRCFDKNVTGEWIDYSEIETSLTIDVDADYIHCFRYTVPLDQYKAGIHGLDLVGDATGVQIEGFVMWENFVFYLNKTTE